MSQDEAIKKEMDPTPRPRTPPRTIRYHPIPGSWQRKDHPHWPESAFHVPPNPPWGTIYFVTKGRAVGHGGLFTAHIELLPSGHVAKTAKTNPYRPEREADHRRDMRTEAAIYQRLGDCPHVPKFVAWDPESCCLTMEHLERGSLSLFLLLEDKASAGAELRQRWTRQAAAAVAALHAVDVVHCDVAPRNFLLDAALNLRISDFAGSSVAGSAPTVAAGSRFQPPGWDWIRPPTPADDIFALGSVMYTIMAGHEPYADMDEDDVEKEFAEGRFPPVSDFICGEAIQGCWDLRFETAQAVVDCLTILYTK